MEKELSKIKTINPVNGCNMGCPYCYARRISDKYDMSDDFSVQHFYPQRIKFHTRKSHTFFINSMSDFAAWEKPWQTQVLEEIAKNPQNNYMALTKRPNLFTCYDLPDWFYYGVTITNNDDKYRIDLMRKNTSGCRYWICFEPVLGPVENIDFTDINFIVIGAETGYRNNKIIPKKEWILKIIDEAKNANVKILLKSSLQSIVGNNFVFDKFF